MHQDANRPTRSWQVNLPGQATLSPGLQLNGEVFYSVCDAQILVEPWCCHYDSVRPHSALGYWPPVPESVIPLDQTPVMH